MTRSRSPNPRRLHCLYRSPLPHPRHRARHSSTPLRLIDRARLIARAATARTATSLTATVLIAIPTASFAFHVAATDGSSTITVLRRWAATRHYEVVWEPRTASGIVNFPASPHAMGTNFHAAVEALVSGAAYGRRNVYCVRPSEYEPHPVFDDHQRVIYVIARPTGNRCIFTYP